MAVIKQQNNLPRIYSRHNSVIGVEGFNICTYTRGQKIVRNKNMDLSKYKKLKSSKTKAEIIKCWQKMLWNKKILGIMWGTCCGSGSKLDSFSANKCIRIRIPNADPITKKELTLTKITISIKNFLQATLFKRFFKE